MIECVKNGTLFLLSINQHADSYCVRKSKTVVSRYIMQIGYFKRDFRSIFSHESPNHHINYTIDNKNEVQVIQ